MNAFVVAVLGMICCAVSGFAAEANGLRLTAQKKLLERDKDHDAFSSWERVEKALGIRVVATNTSFKDLPEGTLEYKVVVRRWGYSPVRLEHYTGTEKLPALLRGAETVLIVGKVPLSGYDTVRNRKQYQDTIEGYQIVAKHDGTETIKVTSTNSFESLFSKSKPGPKVKE